MTLRLCSLLIEVINAAPVSANALNPDFMGGGDTTILDISTGGLREQGWTCGPV
jgi:hypothetical protein